MREYEITSETLALIPINKKTTLAYENHDCYIIEDSIGKIMDQNCKYYGSSIDGRIKGTYSLTGYNYKAPIILSENQNIIFFPTSSPRLKDCAWICVNNIKNITSKESKCLVEFLNQETLEFDTSYNIIKNQYLKSLSLENAFKNRKKEE